ncbi:MAG: hypothetical protein GTO16_05075 [Candidatus Aminicenantes bacterium]|nr:hypothetical protein [Candidatus Aminicenantes bacterium]NIO18168.1 hypothetical protein [bacterium]
MNRNRNRSRDNVDFNLKPVKYKPLTRFKKETEQQVRKIIRKLCPVELQIFDDFNLEIKAITIFQSPTGGAQVKLIYSDGSLSYL